MAATWTLAVEKLGKIRRAEVGISPLTLFVGENNTGKSYLANLIWGLMTLPPWLNPDNATVSYNPCIEWVRKNYLQGSMLLSSDDLDLFANWIRESLNRDMHHVVKYVFGKEFEIGSSNIIIQKDLRPLRVKWKTHDEQSSKDAVYSIQDNDNNEKQLELYVKLEQKKDASENLYMMACLIAHAAITRDLPANSGNPAYFLPASRTGYMLLYPTMTDYSVERTFGRTLGTGARFRPPRLPASAIEFVKLISNGLPDKPGRFAAEADELEKELRGRLEVRKALGINQYYYHSADGHEITMPLSSSLVTELAPIILLLRYAPDISMLVLEEPEVHLHPSVQRKLALTIARLIRKGVNVVITTHSDLFCHQINNLIKLGAHPQRAEMLKKLGYAETDYLLPEEVSGYDFRHVEQHTEVSPLKMTEFGLEMPTFNDELRSLVTESRALEAEPEEA